MERVKLHKNELEYLKGAMNSMLIFGSEKELTGRILKKLDRALSITNVSKPICPKCKGNEYSKTKKGFKCCYTDCQHEWQSG